MADRAPEALTLLHTGGLAGRLDALPKLFTLIRGVRAGLDGPALLLDLGGSCAPGVPECAATQGRATLFVLDAMGYDLACLTGEDCAALMPSAAARLRERVAMAVCGTPESGLPAVVTRTAGLWTVVVTAAPQAEGPVEAALVVRPGAGAPRLEGRTLWLPAGPGDRLGITQVTFGQMGPLECQARSLTIRPETPPDATVAAAVAFVREEVRYYTGGRAGTAPSG